MNDPLQNTVSCSNAQPPHLRIDDAICNLQEVSDRLEALLQEIGAPTTQECVENALAKSAPSLTELLHTAADTIDTKRNVMLDQIARIRELLF